MKNNVNLKFGICGIICSFVLTFFTIHAYAQNPQGLDLLSAPTNSKFNTTTEIVSLVPNVTITKFEILSPESLGLDVKYSGAGKSPAVKVNSSAININSTFEQLANQIGMNNDRLQ